MVAKLYNEHQFSQTAFFICIQIYENAYIYLVWIVNRVYQNKHAR